MKRGKVNGAVKSKVKPKAKRFCKMLLMSLLAALLIGSCMDVSGILAAKATGEDGDPETRRHDVDYNYDYEGEGQTADLSAAQSGKAVSSPFTTSTYRHAARFRDYKVANGIDVSQWQGSINWKKVRKAGVEFAMIRVGYRGSASGSLRADTRYLSYIKGALQAGIKVGVYIYSQATTPAEARAEANFVLKRIQRYNISMPVVLDYEFYTSTSGRLYKAHLNKREATDVCRAFCQTVEQAGYTPMVYGNYDMFNNHLYAGELGQEYLLWIANFGKNNGKDKNFATIYTGTYSFWQYTSRGKVPGIGGYVDCNFWYKTSEITSRKSATGISITDDSVTLTTNNMLYLYHSLSPAGSVDDIQWTSSRPTVAYVKDGAVYGVSGGETVITATTSTGAYDTCKVVVSENLNNYEIQTEDAYDYTGQEIRPEVTVVSKNKQVDAGTAKKKTELFAAPDASSALVGTVSSKASLTIYATSGKYYAASVRSGTQTLYGYCLKKAVKVTKADRVLVPDRDYTVKYSDNTNAGTALIEVTGAVGGIYKGTISKIFTIHPVSISLARVDGVSDQNAAAGAVQPKVTVRYQGAELTEGTDYTVAYTSVSATTGGAVITGTNNFNGSAQLLYGVGQGVAAAVDTVAAQEYTGTALTPALTVRLQDGSVAELGQDYTVTYSDNINIGSGKATVVLNGGDGGSCQVYFPIVERSLTNAKLQISGTYVYNQKPQKCDVTVTDGERTLVEGTDYRCAYSENCCAGTATVRVTGMGNYRGTLEGQYTIQPASISTVSAGKIGSRAYSAMAISPDLLVKDGNTTLLRGVDYTVSYRGNTNPGRATVTLSGTGNYQGSRTLHFTIVKKKIGDCSVRRIGNRKYTGHSVRPQLTIRNSGQKLKRGRDYTVSYGTNRAVGKATVTVRGKGKYTGKKTLSFRIVK